MSLSRMVLVLLLVLPTLSACSGSGSSSDSFVSQNDEPEEISISGAVQKGPFIVGTQVHINRLDDFGNASESTTITEITDSIGSFSFSVSESGPVQIISDGYYFSELTGEISSGTLALKAIYNASSGNEQQAYVNVLTHLSNNRVLQLIENGDMTIQNAIDQAQSELVSELQVVLPVDTVPNFSELSVYNNDTENSIGNAYLLALSTAFYKYAEMEAEGRDTSPDAQLALVLNQIANDFALDGVIQQTDFKSKLTSALRRLNPRAIADNLRSRSEIDFVEAIEVPDITRFFGLCAGGGDCMWSAVAPMPFPTRSHASAVYNEKIYVFGGDTPFDEIDEALVDITDSAAKGAFVYDPSTNEWAELERLPIGLRYLTAHTIDDKIYLFGGYGKGGFLNTVLAYDPAENSWEEKASMPSYRYVFMSQEVSGKVYVIGGQGIIDDGPWRSGADWVFKSHVEIYDPAADSWSRGSDAPETLASAASCSLGDDIYILGGSDLYRGKSDTYVYNVNSDAWTARSPALTSRGGHTCVEMGNEFYLFGGRDNQGALDDIEIYAPQTDSWSKADFMPTARYWHTGNAIGPSIYLMGGIEGGAARELTDSIEVMDTSWIGQ